MIKKILATVLCTTIIGSAISAKKVENKVPFGKALPKEAKTIEIYGEPWLLCGPAPLLKDGTPVDMNEYNPNEKGRRTVDFTIWQDVNKLWHIWHNVLVKIPKKDGDKFQKNIVFYEQTGKGLEKEFSPWTPKGISLISEEKYGDFSSVTSPYLYKENDSYYMYYRGASISVLTSKDGITFIRPKLNDNININGLFGNEPGFPSGWARDQKVIKVKDTYYMYYMASGKKKVKEDNEIPTAALCRTSSDPLGPWSKPKLVFWGGVAGYGMGSAECPNVVYLDGLYYLIISGDKGSHLYCSSNPFNFGLDDDKYHTGTRFHLDAIELIEVDGQWYILWLQNGGYKGIGISKMRWIPIKKENGK